MLLHGFLSTSLSLFPLLYALLLNSSFYIQLVEALLKSQAFANLSVILPAHGKAK